MITVECFIPTVILQQNNDNKLKNFLQNVWPKKCVNAFKKRTQ